MDSAAARCRSGLLRCPPVRAPSRPGGARTVLSQVLVVSLYRVHSLFGRTKAFVLSRIRLRKLACTRYRDTTRKTICFSKTIQMHDIVIGLFVNRYAFERAVYNMAISTFETLPAS